MKKIHISEIVFSMFLISFTAAGEIETKTFDAKKIKFLNVQLGSGDVTIQATKNNQSTVKANKINSNENCKLYIELENSALNVKQKKTNDSWFSFSKKECKFIVDITVPSALDISLKGGSNNTKIENTSGNINFKLGSGNIKIDAEIKNLSGTAGSGNVLAKGLIGDSKIKLGSGNLELSYKQLPPNGSIDIKTGSGNASIFLPENSKIKSHFKAGSGTLFNELGESKDSNFEIAMKTGSGNLTIRKK